MKFTCGWFVVIMMSMGCISVTGKTFHVSDFGAQSNDNVDDSKRIQSAIDAAIRDGPNNIVTFGNGTYNISTTIGISNGTNLTIEGEGIGQTLLVGTSKMFLFFAQYCNGLTIRSLSIDFDPLPFTAGYVLNSTNTYLDVQVQPPHRTDIDQRVEGLIRYDPTNMRPAFGAETYNFYQVPPRNVTTSLVSPGILRIPVASKTAFVPGNALLAVYDISYHAIFAHDSSDLLVQSINIQSSWGMAFVTIRVKRLTISDYHVTPSHGRWLSANSDCMHFISTTDYVSLSDSKCQMQGDDGLNVLTPYITVTEVVNSSALIIGAFNYTDPLIIENGAHLEFSSNKQPFTAYSTGTVALSTLYSPTSRLFLFTGLVNASISDYVCLADTPALTIRNFTVENNRARGVLLETRNIDIRNCIFNRTSGPAVFMQPSLYWYEGPPGRNITLADNLYINCNEGIGQEQGLITILPDPIQLVPVIDDIRIESSTFYFGNFSRGLLQLNNAGNLHLTGNYIGTNSSMPLISICNSRNITASNNTVANTQSKIDQYYVFDETNPCQMNLSSLIDLPPSAFNSSFPPPVTLTESFFPNNEDLFITNENKENQL